MKRWMIAALASCCAAGLHAADKTVELNAVSSEGVGKSVGTVVISQSAHGVVFTPQLHDQAPGIHGFHVHAKPSCEAAANDQGKQTAAQAAGGHWDPQNTDKHGTPWGDGHLGDLPALLVTADGKASQPVLAPRIKSVDELKDLAIMVHAGGDNHSDHPSPLGGGAARVACGVIK